MADFPSDRTAARAERDAWRHDNDRGLRLAQDGDWAEATEAFASAADCLGRSLPDGRALTGESHHEPLALVLGNLAQACFRLGHLDEALRHAQRACALRVAITGEDGMPVARARMDLAVMLASSGRLDEATALIQRAIAGIEHRVGEEDARLAPVLENAARIALASGRPANAEPLLLRLHALLDAHDRSTASADLLLAQVAEVRAYQRAAVAAPVMAPAAVPAAVSMTTPVSAAYVDGFDDASTQVYAHASITDLADWEDQPLRDAVAVTDHLLRTTPTGVPIVPPTVLLDSPDLAVNDDTVAEAEALLDTLDLTDVLPAADAEPAPAPAPTTAPALLPDNGLLLDLAVEHGMANDEAVLVQRAPISLPVPGMFEPALARAPEVAVAPQLGVVSAGSTRGIAPIDNMVATAPPMPETSAAAAVPTAPARPTPVPTGGQRPVRRSSESRVVLPAPTESKGKSQGVLIALGAAIVAAGGVAAFFLLR
ncbi:tetratricopeptide repeat protein [Gemmatimonas sp.]|uniref:tetratricopeptide repeat protein n=1 Tax=Gemmatimonas sp. TaxID=1962908 RepID=UPI0022C78994|nr:tetratricopeptide repeat protein [Gemmatimonas sp.]MCZ8203566.1 tetratricopeptide repeat protein [Gemmatimonas sp.]